MSLDIIMVYGGVCDLELYLLLSLLQLKVSVFNQFSLSLIINRLLFVYEYLFPNCCPYTQLLSFT